MKSARIFILHLSAILAAALFVLACPGYGQDSTQKLLEQLANAAGPPGAEEPVRALMVAHMKRLADELQYDGMGSVIARQGSAGPRVMVDAHMDELGGMIRRITPNGFLTMQMLGGWLDQALVDQRWIILGSKGPVQAVTGIRDTHVISPAERSQVFPRDSLLLDVGAKDAAEVKAMGIEPGDPVVPDSPFAVLNGTGNYLAKAWDDRLGCALLIAVMQRMAKQSHPNRIFYAATTQEELGVRGATTATQVVRPDIAIAIEGGIAGDTFLGHPEETQVSLGAGPVLFLYDSLALPNRKLVVLVKQTAADSHLPLQLDLVNGYGEDSAPIQVSNGGVPTVSLLAPVRYTHAHNGILNRRDFDQLVDLVVALITRLDQNTVDNVRSFAPAP
jgi:endoglucanase